MFDLILLINGLGKYIPIIKLIAILVIVVIVFNFIVNLLKNRVIRRFKNKRYISNLEIFAKVIKYLFLIILIFAVFSSYVGSWTGFGIGVGFLTAALGWALQRPITGMAAWIMVITKRPFDIGDRILIGDTKGDVSDISLTHIHLNEIGGTIASEEHSGRTILIPNSILFEQKIINYTMIGEYILDEVVTSITYESDLKKAKEICYNAALKFLDETLKKNNDLPFIRVFQSESGISVKVRYRVKTTKRIETLSNIHDEIITNIVRTPRVKIAYPHIDIVK